jgi:hypothetical protein
MVEYLRSAEGEQRVERLETVATAVEELLHLVPAAARSVYHLLVEFYWGDTSLLLGVIRRLLPDSADVEQMQWHELPLVMTQHEARSARGLNTRHAEDAPRCCSDTSSRV